MKTPIHSSSSLLAAAVLFSVAPVSHLTAQVDGKPGVDATPAQLRPPVEQVDEKPPTNLSGAKPVDLDPKIVQAKAVTDGEEIPKTDLTLGKIVGGSEDFTTLMTALKAAGLADMLNADGPFTVLAPNNAAFAALPAGVLQVLLKPENRPVLKKILAYHVLPAKMMAGDFIPGEIPTAAGEPLMVTAGEEGALTIQGAKFGIKDVAARNGMIQVIDHVLLPPSIDIEKIGKPVAK